MSDHILVVDDNQQILDLLKNVLEQEGFGVTTANTGESARLAVEAQDFDLVVMDIGLPDEDGFSLTREIRSSSNIPIIILTGKHEEMDHVLGLELGADDYVVKPFRPREFVARVRTVLRRAATAEEADVLKTTARPPVLGFLGWALDLGARQLSDPDGKPVHLTTFEFDLLATLLRNANQTGSRNDLLKACTGREWLPTDRSVDIHIGRLRAKVEKNPKTPRIIKSVRGLGYIFAAPVTRQSAVVD